MSPALLDDFVRALPGCWIWWKRIEMLGLGAIRGFHPRLERRQLDNVLELDQIEFPLQMLADIDGAWPEHNQRSSIPQNRGANSR